SFRRASNWIKTNCRRGDRAGYRQAYGPRDAAAASQTIAPEEPTQHELADTDDPKLDRKSSGRGKGKPAGGGWLTSRMARPLKRPMRVALTDA
ncbi:MAG: hypothetical protein WAN44_19630, partial [Propionibacteriaceae bacterium]